MIFYRWFQLKFCKGQWSSYFKRVFQIEKELSPFNRNSLANYQNILSARSRFVKYLHNCQKNNKHELTPELRLAEIIISAALFSYVCNKHRLEDIIDAIFSRLHRFNNHVFLDLKCTPLAKNESKNVFRWFPDNISLALISGFNFDAEKPDLKNVHREIVILLKKLMPDASKPSLQSLCQINYSALCIELPGFLVAVATGKINAVSIPLPSFIRILSGKSLIPPPKKPNIKKSGAIPWSFDIRNGIEKANYLTAHNFHKKLTEIIKQAEKETDNSASNKKKKQKTKLIHLAEELISGGTDWPITCNLIAAWVIHLCKHGTKFVSFHQGNRLHGNAYNTIKKYSNIVSNALTQYAYNKPLLQLSDFEYEELYTQASLITPATSRSDSIGRLREFHYFLTLHWPVEEPNWNAIYAAADCDTSDNLADANILTEAEYLRTLNSVNSSIDLTEIERLQYTFILILGYRFGLRFSEAFNLLYRDLQFDSVTKSYMISVHDTHHGQLKSKSSTRKLGQLDSKLLVEIERNTITKLLDYFSVSFERDHSISFLAQESSNSDLIDKSQTSLDINSLLRNITGDKDIRFHHMRHSWANRVFNNSNHHRSLINEEPFSFTRHYANTTYQYESTLLSLKETSRLMGHACEETILNSYLHHLDSLLYDYGKLVTPELSLIALTYATQMKYDNTRQRVKRYSNKDNNYLNVLNIYKIINVHEVQLVNPTLYTRFKKHQTNQKLITLPMVNDLLIELSKPDCNHSRIAERFLLSDAIISQLVEIIIQIEKYSGYDRFKFYKYDNNPLDLPVNELVDLTDESEELRTYELLPIISERISKYTSDELKIIVSFLNLWKKGYQSYSDGIMVYNVDHIISYRDGHRLLGFDDISLTVIIPIEHKEKLKHQIKDIKHIKYKYKSLNLAKEKSNYWKLQRYLIKFNAEGSTTGTVKNYHRLIFCLLIFHKLTNF